MDGSQIGNLILTNLKRIFRLAKVTVNLSVSIATVLLLRSSLISNFKYLKKYIK